MSKKIVALILLLPLVLMMTLFTAVQTVSLRVNIPVSKIKIMGEKFISLDLDKQERYYLDYVIYPTVAVNKKVSVSLEQVGTQQLAQIEYNKEDGYIYPKQAGVANVLVTTADGGFRDAFQVVVKETKLKQINCSTDKNWLYVGETMKINTEFIPATANNKMLDYISTDNSILTVDDNGFIKAKSKGTANIMVSSLADPTIVASLEITVKAQGVFSLSETQTSISTDDGEVFMTINTDQEYSISYGVYDLQGRSLDGVITAINPQEQFANLGDGKYKFAFNFIDEDFYGTVVIKFTLTTQDGTIDRTFTITRVEGLDAQFNNEDDIFCTEIGKTFNWKNQITVSESSVEYSVVYSNDNLSVGSFSYLATANKMGVTRATITIKSKKNLTQTVTLQKDVYIYPEMIQIKESMDTYAGIESILTIGKYDAKGEQVNHDLTLSFGGDTEGAGFEKVKEKIVFETSAPEVKVKDGGIKILDDNFMGIVDITAKLDIGGVQKSSQAFSVRCVGSGVEIDNFMDLYKATKNKKIVVLIDDIIDDFGKDEGGNNFYQGSNIDWLESTYDTQYYKNLENPNTKIITLLQFKADLYGNGHIISANNVTNTSSTGGYNSDSLFKGPLNLVAMSDSASSLISVKGQDNVCFAVFEKTTINNVELKGYEFEKSRDDTYDLTDLDYAGTVLEVFGDNVNIEYSRINNGRTVLRAFGDIVDNTKDIHVNIKNCVLSFAREFIVRIGSNLIVRDEKPLTNDNYDAPYLGDSYDLEFPAQQTYSSYGDDLKREHEQKYIKTFVNIENSVLKDSGIFCIGIDSHFAGPMLVDGERFSPLLSGWEGISGTSYGAKLTFNGDVRIYDWKNIKNIDSSTLIENKATNEQLSNIKLNVNEMISKLGDTSMIYLDKETGEKYVHGGIVFFGGGKNYSVFENNGQSFKGLLPQGNSVEFSNYKISLSNVGMKDLQLASGDKPFYFIVYDMFSQFNPLKQFEILQKEGDAYSCIRFKH